MEKAIKRILDNMPAKLPQQKAALRRLQFLNNEWRRKQEKWKKNCLHCPLVKGAKTKKTIDKVLNPRQAEPISPLDDSKSPTTPVTEPEEVGSVFPTCASSLGGDPDFAVDSHLLNDFISNARKRPPSTRDDPLPMPTSEWLKGITQTAKPTEGTREDEINYHIISICPPEIQRVFLASIHHVLHRGPPPAWARARVCLLHNKGDVRKASNYRLIHLIQPIWHNIAQNGKLPHRLSPKDGQLGKMQGCMALIPFQIFVRSQFFNYSMGYLNGDSPLQCTSFVPQALTASKANWLQNAFVDAVHALGGRCHRFRPRNPCPVSGHAPGETGHVRFNNGLWSGEVLRHCSLDKAAPVCFDVNNTTSLLKDRIHNFIAQQPPQLVPQRPPAPNTSSLPQLFYMSLPRSHHLPFLIKQQSLTPNNLNTSCKALPIFLPCT